MGIYSILEQIQDQRKGSNESTFNGYLEDYLEMMDEESKEYKVFKALFDINNDLKIIVGLKLNISKESISNQIIRYKDIFKLDGNPIECPYIVYMKQDELERAILFSDDGYIFAKGIYYCMTEPYNRFQEAKNDFVAMAFDKPELVVKIFSRLFKVRAGVLQRDIDHTYYEDYEASFNDALSLAQDIKLKAEEDLKNNTEAEEYIRNVICKWFLLKKFVYVQYMVNKELLQSVHEGNVKKQRNQAKTNADQISFISFSEMWKLATAK